MLIRCPECQFERTIDTSQIPHNAIMATCPRCQNRFCFRDVEGHPTADQTPQYIEESTEEHTTENHTEEPLETPVAPAPENETGRETLQEQDDDDPLPPGAVIPKIPGVTTDTDDASEATRKEQGGSRKKSGGIEGFFKDGFLKPKEKTSSQAEQDNGQTNKPLGAFQEKNATPENDLSVPWEQPRRYGLFMGLYQTILRVMFNAPRFFAGLPSSGPGLLRPLIFYLVLGMFQTLVERMWYLMRLQAVEPSITDPQVQEMVLALTQSMSLPLTLLLAPVFLTMQLCFFASVFFLMLRLVHPENAHFRTVFKIIAYSAAPTLVCVVPLVGPVVGSVWFGICCFVGCKYALRLPWVRTALALGPLYLIAFAIGLQIIRQLLGS